MRVTQLYLSVESGEKPYSYMEVVIEELGRMKLQNGIPDSIRDSIFKLVEDYLSTIIDKGNNNANLNP